jgi:hypothetical protein
MLKLHIFIIADVYEALNPMALLAVGPCGVGRGNYVRWQGEGAS